MKLLKRMRGTLEAATRKSKYVLEMNKWNQHLKKIKTEVDHLYELIGEKVYRDPSLAKEETRTYIDVQVHVLESLHRKVQDVKQKMLYLKDSIKCDVCDKILSVDTKFCPDCGNDTMEQIRKTREWLEREEQQNET